MVNTNGSQPIHDCSVLFLSSPKDLTSKILPIERLDQFLLLKKIIAISSRVVLFLVLGILIVTPRANAEAICAEVKMEIRQKLNVERQGFIATLRINNGLDETPLTNIGVNIKFADRNGISVPVTMDVTNTSASFFMREDLISGITGGVQGSGTIEPKTKGEANWLIIPAPGSGGTTAAGEVYSISGTLTYQEGTQERVVELSPEMITVMPQPLLELDYFLPREVYADDPFTNEIEPSEPFSLGVRVSNSGAGLASSVSIESAQPKIVENEQGLLIAFEIDGAYVEDQPADSSLLVNFGSIDPQRAKVARWLMTTTLSGRFVEFTSEFTHADSLGGAVTSLLQRVTTHTLLKDVLVDLPGRDNIRDFLALDGEIIRVYENEGLDTEVVDQSAATQLIRLNSSQFTINFPALQGAMFAQVTDPTAGRMEINQLKRSDGKLLPLENVWKSRRRNQAGTGWLYFINLFDIGGTGAYVLDASFAETPASLMGKVFLDIDGDSVQALTESSLLSVVMTLNGVSSNGVTIRQFTRSDATGVFTFDNVPPGTYYVVDGDVDQMEEGLHQVGSAGGLVQTDRITEINLEQGTVATGYVFVKRPSQAPPTTDISAGIVYADDIISLGEATSATISIHNAGSSAASAVVSWQMPEEIGLLLASSPIGTITSELSVWRVPSLAAGETAELRLDVRAESNGTAVLNVVAATDAIDSLVSNNLASDTLEIGLKPEVSQELDKSPRVLALVSCYVGVIPDVSCTNQRKTHLSAILAEVGVEHAVVTTTLAYREALRSGRYNVHWVSGGANQMTDELAEELRNALRRGEGLITDGRHDTRSAVLDDVIELGYHNEETTSAPPFTTNNTLFDGTITLTPTGASLSIDALGGSTSSAVFDDGSQAIVSNQFGAGRTLTFAFELIDSVAAATTDRAIWIDLIIQSLNWLTYTPTANVVGRDFLAIVTRLQNPLDNPVTIKIEMTLDLGIELATSNQPLPADATTSLPYWLITVQPDQTVWLKTGFHVPTVSGSVGVNTRVTWQQPNDNKVLLKVRQAMNVTAVDTRFDALTANLLALTIEPEQLELRDSVLSALDQARVLIGNEHPSIAIPLLVMAEEALITLSDNQSTLDLEELSRLLKEAGLLWQRLNPLCGAADEEPLSVDPATFWPFGSNEGMVIRGGLPNGEDWKWGLGTNTKSDVHSIRESDFEWISGELYNWQLDYITPSLSTLVVYDQLSSLLTLDHVSTSALGMRSGEALLLTAKLNSSELETPTLISIDQINGIETATVLNIGIAPQLGDATAVYFPAMATGLSVDGSIKIDFPGSLPPQRSKLQITLHAGEVACRPELSR